MICSNFTFKGEENIDIYTYKYEPKNKEKVKGVIQIAHGMSETAKRYEYFAKRLVKEGYIVYINDHRGHGLTANKEINLGNLGESDGFNHLVKDMNNLTKIIRCENPNNNVYLFGHSMGSFASQKYLMEHFEYIDGLILSGSNGESGKILDLASIITKFYVKTKGRECRVKIIDLLIFGGNNRFFKPSKTPFDWLSRDEEEVKKYIEDPYCGKLFTCGFFDDLIGGLKDIEDKKNLKKVPTNIPIYILSGDKDPIGKNGKGIIKLKDRYINLGVKDVSYKLYKDGRHEMLNEINKDEVIDDVIKWLKERETHLIDNKELSF